MASHTGQLWRRRTEYRCAGRLLLLDRKELQCLRVMRWEKFISVIPMTW